VKIKKNKPLQRSLEKLYWRETRKVLAKIRQPLIDQAEHSDPETLRMMLPHLLLNQPLVDHLINIWGKVGGRFAFDTDKIINSGKKAVKKLQSEYEAQMRAYAYQRSLLKARKILTTQQEVINRVITEVVDRSINEGLSIYNTRRLMQEELSGDALTSIENYQAERIARTEVNGASNTGSFEAMREMGIDAKKEWLTSGLPNVRETHQHYESLGAVEMDYEYAPGLQFPGDENGEAEEIINCRCTIIYNTEN
jgi:hypothetical protein